MDDIVSMINQFLSDPESVKQLNQLMGALGTDQMQSPAPISANPQNQGNMGGQQGGYPPQNNVPYSQGSAQPPFDIGKLLGLNNGGAQPFGGTNLDVGTLLTIQKALSSLNQPDDNIVLLNALKPHFSAARAKKVDDAIKILGLIKLLPLLKDSGLFK